MAASAATNIKDEDDDDGDDAEGDGEAEKVDAGVVNPERLKAFNVSSSQLWDCRGRGADATVKLCRAEILQVSGPACFAKTLCLYEIQSIN